MAVDPARAKSLFLAASEIADPAERAAYLDRECSEEAELRARVEALLRANDASPLPESEPAEATGNYVQDAPAAGASEQAGTIIAGKYTLVELIGEGGMGSVWRAKQTEPVKRFVAVKLIKAGMDSKQVLARFEAERQALALMDHPNIAKVLDGGLHEHRPFFVMEQVKGVPITDFCDARKLTPKERLELFVPVCQAIQHAHQKGIIHRDIKPSKVLIALYDDKPVVKVIDFGVAKATGGTLTEQTIDTGFGGVVGTPQYMSPEQATFNNLDIDTRSDVYALGVLLYELLTGSPPFSKKDLEKKGLLEILRVVREEEPPRPSIKLSTDDALPTLSAIRGTEPKKLTGLLRNELDWIVMKALEKDRARRYETANGFAADVLRYLGGEAVLAHPPSTVYRLKKFVKRYKGQVLAVSVVFFALVAGIVGTTLGLLEAKRQELAALAAKDQAERERDRADGNFRLAKDAVEQTVTRVAENQLLKQGDFHDLRKALLSSAVPFYERFVQQVSDDPGLEAERGRAYGRLALVRKEMGELKESRSDYERALAIFTRLAAENPSARDPRIGLGSTYNNLGIVLQDMGDLKGAEAAYRADLKETQLLADQNSTETELRRHQAISRNNLGIVLSRQGYWKAAEREYRAAREEARRLVEEDPNNPDYLYELAKTHNHLGLVLKDLGKWAEAEEEYRAALKAGGQLAGRDPADPYYRQFKANSHQNLGNLLSGMGQRRAAEAEYRAGLKERQRLVDEHPTVPDYRSKQTGTRVDLGNLLLEIGQWPAAEAEYRAALKEQQRLVNEHPTVPDYRLTLSVSHHSLGNLLDNLGKLVEAEVEFRAALEELQRPTVKYPDMPHYRSNLAESRVRLGDLLKGVGKPLEAEAELRAALKEQQRLVADFPLPAYRRALSNIHNSLGILLHDLGRQADSEAEHRAGLKELRRLVADHPTVPQYRVELAKGHNNLGSALLDQNRREAAEVEFRTCLEELRWLTEHVPSVPEYQLLTGVCHGNLGELVLPDVARRAEAETELKQASDILAKLVSAHPKVPDYAEHLGVVDYNYACLEAIRMRESAGNGPLQDQHAAKAMAWLRKAKEHGAFTEPFYRRDIEKNTDLGPLRKRPDFQKLLSELNKPG